MKKLVIAAVVTPFVLIAFIGAAFSFGGEERGGINVDALPPLAKEMLPTVERIQAASCPEMPVVFILAHVMAESSWTATSYSSAGAAGLYQMMPFNWPDELGGGWGGRPAADHLVWDPTTHLEFGIPWVCGNLRNITLFVQVAGLSIDPLDAMLVCHVAGCSRVTASATGIPEPGDAGCGAACSATVKKYIENVHRYIDDFTLKGGSGAAVGNLGPPQPWTGGGTGCVHDDPTTGGCVTGATRHMINEVNRVTGGWPWGMGCHAARPNNPTSDHPQGKGCDLYVGTLGQFPNETDTASGWAMATWLEVNADALGVKYIIWDGDFWQGSWGPYFSGIYNIGSPTGGHYDHIHVSMQF